MVLGNNRARAERRNEPLTPGDGNTNIRGVDIIKHYYLILHWF